jgi:hypothetical protein
MFKISGQKFQEQEKKRRRSEVQDTVSSIATEAEGRLVNIAIVKNVYETRI